MQEKDKPLQTEKNENPSDDEEIFELSDEAGDAPDDEVMDLTDVVKPPAAQDDQIIDLSGTEIDEKHTKTLELTDVDRKAIKNELKQVVKDEAQEKEEELEELAGGPMSDKLTLNHVDEGEPDMIDIIDFRKGAAIQESSGEDNLNNSRGSVDVEELAGGPMSDTLTEEEVPQPEMIDVIDLREEDGDESPALAPDEEGISETIDLDDLEDGLADGDPNGDEAVDSQPDMMNIIDLDEAFEQEAGEAGSQEVDLGDEKTEELLDFDLKSEIGDEILDDEEESEISIFEDSTSNTVISPDPGTLEDAVELKDLDGQTLAMELDSSAEESIIQEDADSSHRESGETVLDLNMDEDMVDPDPEKENVVDMSGVDDAVDILTQDDLSGSEVIEVEDLEIEDQPEESEPIENSAADTSLPQSDEGPEELGVDELVMGAEEDEEEIDIGVVDFEDELSGEEIHIPDKQDESEISPDTVEVQMSSPDPTGDAEPEIVEVEDLEFDEGPDEQKADHDKVDLGASGELDQTVTVENGVPPDLPAAEDSAGGDDEELNIDILDEPFEFGEPEEESTDQEISLEQEKPFAAGAVQDEAGDKEIEGEAEADIDLGLYGDEVEVEVEHGQSEITGQEESDSQIGIELEDTGDFSVDDEIKLTASPEPEVESGQEVEDDLVDSMGMTIETNFKALEEPVETEVIKEAIPGDGVDEPEPGEVPNEIEKLDDIEPGESIAETVMLSTEAEEQAEPVEFEDEGFTEENGVDPDVMTEPREQPEFGPISSKQLEESIEKVISKMFSEKIDNLLESVIERTVTTEIEKLKRILEEPDEDI